MDYYELKIFTTTSGVGIITALLDGHGVSGTCVDDPKDAYDLLNKKNSYDWDYFNPELINKKNSYDWDYFDPELMNKKNSHDRDYFDPQSIGKSSEEVVITFYLEKAPESLKLIRDIFHEIEVLNAAPYDFSLGSLRTECKLRSDEEWKDAWKAFFKPHLLVEGLWIKPGWEAFTPVNKSDIVLELDPGIAFGTGKHETTALCANLMMESLKPGDSVLDVGCGSGILSVAAALLGAAEVLAVDIDEDAISVTGENVKKNNCEDIVRVVRGDLARGIDFKSDIVLANLTVDLIVELLGHVKNNMKKDAVFIASGVLTEKRSQAKNAFHMNGFHIIEERTDGEWCAFSARVEV